MSGTRITQEQQQNEKRLDILSFTTNFPEDYLPYTSSYHRKAPYLVWEDHRKVKRRKRYSCLLWVRRSSARCTRSTPFMACVAGVGVALVLAIIAFSIYLGWLTHFKNSPVLSLSGKLRVIEGDTFSPLLLNISSQEFQAKAAKYEELLNSVYTDTNLQNSLVKVQVYAFREGSLVVYFNVFFDPLQDLEEENLPWKAKEILLERVEQTANFTDLKIDKQSLDLSEYPQLETNINVETSEDLELHTFEDPGPQTGFEVPGPQTGHSSASTASSSTSTNLSLNNSTRSPTYKDTESSTAPHLDSHQGTDRPILLTYGEWRPLLVTQTTSPTDKIITVPQPIVVSDYQNLKTRLSENRFQTYVPLTDQDEKIPTTINRTFLFSTESMSVDSGMEVVDTGQDFDGVVLGSPTLFLKVPNETESTLKKVIHSGSSSGITTSLPYSSDISNQYTRLNNSGNTSPLDDQIGVYSNENQNSTTQIPKLDTDSSILPTENNNVTSKTPSTEVLLGVSISQSIRTETALPVTLPSKVLHSQTRFLPDILVGVPLVVLNGEQAKPSSTLRRIEFGTKHEAPIGEVTHQNFQTPLKESVKGKPSVNLTPHLSAFDLPVEAGISIKGSGQVFPRPTTQQNIQNNRKEVLKNDSNTNGTPSVAVFEIPVEAGISLKGTGSVFPVHIRHENAKNTTDEPFIVNTNIKKIQTTSTPAFEIPVEAGISLKGTGSVFTVRQDLVAPELDDNKSVKYIPDRKPKPVTQPLNTKETSTELTVGASLFIRNSQDKVKLQKSNLPVQVSRPSTVTNTIPTSPRPSTYLTTYPSPPLGSPELTINAPFYIRGSSTGQAYNPLLRQGHKLNSTDRANFTDSAAGDASISSPTIILKVSPEHGVDGSTRDTAGRVPKIISQYVPYNDGFGESKKPNYDKERPSKEDPNHFYEKPVYPFSVKINKTLQPSVNLDLTTIMAVVSGHNIFSGTTNDILTSTKPASITKAPNVLSAHLTESSEKENAADSDLDLIEGTFNKECDPVDEFRCSSGSCIDKTKQCNRLKDCSDASDETNCSCADYLRTRIFRSKICDGIVDCWDFSDEINCAWCSADQFICPGAKMCIPQEKVCDDVPDCPAAEDETHCVTLQKELTATASITTAPAQYKQEGLLLVRRKGQWGKVCVDNFPMTSLNGSIEWTLDELGKSICNSLSFKGMALSTRISDHYTDIPSTYFQLKGPSSVHNLLSSNGVLKTSCPSKDIVKISCNSLECGLRPLSLGFRRRIVGGHSSNFGSWPWQVALYKEGDFQCGAVVINDQWLISAGHCFYHSKGSHWTARLGLLRRGSEIPSPFEQIRNITHIFLHPHYIDRGFINDIVLLRMDKAAEFSDHIRPLCLPEAAEVISSWEGQLCTAVGWGKLFEVGRIFPDTLQEVQLPIISTEECRKRTVFLPLYKITDNMFCAGFERGGRDACLGDSGGPLMCQRGNGRWALVGVTSNGDGCGRPGRPGVYTKVANYMPWIRSIMENTDHPVGSSSKCEGHRCALGKCLSSKRVCDGAWDCWDGSDEKDC